ncbi:MAG: hypothetical protein ACXWE4_03800 [Methylobacter sp.]
MIGSNTQDQTEQDKLANTSTIKFTHAASREIDFNQGTTVFGDLFMIGALVSTKVTKHNSEALWSEYATDVKDLRLLHDKCGETIYTLTDMISSLGVMLAYVDRREVGDKHLDNYAWLVTGLGELLSQLSRADEDMVHSLLELSKQAAVIPLAELNKQKTTHKKPRL